MKKKINLIMNGFRYSCLQNEETGELEVVEFSKHGVVQKMMDYAKAEVSKVLESLPLAIIEARKVACDSCDSCRKNGEAEWYCNSCGCPQWERSKLQNKWEMPAATCPLARWPTLNSNNASS